ncbi:ABC transporter ATP-binding protein [Hydrococcus rivularis NIES-593]|uniref:ABC transporter ATP-binding protein n=1 Tax=Hydrococcus rivularis NIES-593 TaxID=1921803 RepID=A0A1U7HNJ9_9CYAN|nr:ATP-binding cassette domain-containing protein [Hydrococcus rivularis]OKH25134.1 ABC transporter ATP-binding protein [Hydrococcus rivularis NIES-593]
MAKVTSMFPEQLVLRYAAKYPSLIFLTFILSFSAALFNGISTALIVPLLLGGLSGNLLNLDKAPEFLKNFMSFFDGFSDEIKPLIMFGVVFIAIVLKNATNYISSLVNGHLSRSLVNSMKLDGIKLLLEVDLDYYAKNKTGDIISYLSHDINETAGTIQTGILILRTAVTVLTYIGLLILISWQLTVISTVLIAGIFFLNQNFLRISKKLGQELSQVSKQYSNKILEIVTANRLIRVAKTEEKEYQKIQQLVLALEKSQFYLQINDQAIQPINEVLGIIVLLTIVISGRYLFSGNLPSVTTVLLAYLLLLYKLLPFVSQLNHARNELAKKAFSVKIATNFLQRENKPFMIDCDRPQIYSQLEEGIRFENVSFVYPDTDTTVLNEINLWIPKGKTIALVGSSGAGKSTLADLLPRFYDPSGGRITIDGIDLREYDLKSLRQAMGIVSQDTFLFNNSVRYNITYGLEDVSEERLIDAAKLANAYEFIMQLPNGFDTEIGDRGVMLSGGQRQRLAIARALIRNPDILILDEATSALDTASERLVQQAIDRLSRNRTILAIAHRLSTIQKAYQIAVLDKGHIVELGNHEQLLAQNGYYARLYSMQFAESPR